MKKLLVVALLSSMMLSACAGPQQRGPKRPLKLDANPSALLALEIAMEQLGNEKGRSEGLRYYAAPDAVLFVPDLVVAPVWLKSNKNLPPIDWDVHRVIMSCDGKTGVTTGAWTASDDHYGYFTTVWQRYEKRDGSGEWRWVLTHDDRLKKPRKVPDFIQTETASCKGKAPANLVAPPEGVQMKQGLSRDQSLSWTWQYRPDKSRSLTIATWDGEKNNTVLQDEVAAK
ncbi:hypothetical protein ACFOWX_01580 [Sphingorhabdus arenilitoris]|uniref:DUF4440 domain-containing protein n=1 Tax=Sphingorhabdus arenilitoris TaxID=1490041 RepID=A0ABV8RD02_9SPHN